MKVECFLSLGHMELSNGENIRFWEDRWLENFTLQHMYPSLYSITRQKNILVALFFSTVTTKYFFSKRACREQPCFVA
jgi:hypothetical protein